MQLTLRGRVDRLVHLFKALTQQHHTEMLPLLRPLVPADGVIVDVGAHAGQFTKLLARLAPLGRIVAVEPSPYVLGILRAVVRWRRLRHVEVVAAALSDAPGVLTLATPIKRSGSVGFGLASLTEQAPERSYRTDAVPVETLDAVVDRLGLDRLDLIKCDVEGWEAHMLRGARESLARFRPPLVLEVVESSLARAGETPGTIWSLLGPLGYRGRRLPESSMTGGFQGDGDYLFVPDGERTA